MAAKKAEDASKLRQVLVPPMAAKRVRSLQIKAQEAAEAYRSAVHLLMETLVGDLEEGEKLTFKGMVASEDGKIYAQYIKE